MSTPDTHKTGAALLPVWLQGPDGAPGFSFGRGKGLEALQAAADAAPGSAPGVVLQFAGLPLRGILARNLSVEAPAFVPGGGV